MADRFDGLKAFFPGAPREWVERLLESDDTTDELTIGGAPSVHLDITPGVTPTAEGSLFWDSGDHTLALKSDEAESTLQVGQESWIRVYNDSGSTINNGSVVYASGAEGSEGRLTIALARADSGATSKVIGFATHDIEDATFGYVTQFGLVRDLDTSPDALGDILYLSATTAGGIVNVPPAAPNRDIFLGYVVAVHATEGVVFVTTLGNTSSSITGIAGAADELVVEVRKGSVGTITNGQPVYVSGYNLGQESVEVELAEADAASRMPAVGIAAGSITNSANGIAVVGGRITNVDTSAWAVGDSLYISEIEGELTNVRPAAPATKVQKVGTVARSNAINGTIYVQGAGRQNDVPNSIDTDIEINGKLTIDGIEFLVVNADPNGSVTAPRGSIATSVTTGALYSNTDGGTTWVAR